jgi:hypothetical protein
MMIKAPTMSSPKSSTGIQSGLGPLIFMGTGGV